MKTNRKVLTAKIESTYGDGAAATMALSVFNVKPTLLNTSKIEVGHLKPGFGHDKVIQAGANAMLEFEMDLAGSGVAGDAPACGDMLRACGFSETLAAGTSATYSPISENAESLSMFFYYDGDLHQLKGARGDASISMRQLDRPTIKFSFTGIYVPVSAQALPTPTFATSAAPVAVSDANTQLMTLSGEPLALSQFELTVGNTPVYRNLINLEEVIITERKSGLKLQFDRPNVASKDWFAHVLAGATGPLAITHGKAAGNIVAINAGKAQATELGDADADTVAQLDMTARLLSPSGAGDDEFTFVFT